MMARAFDFQIIEWLIKSGADINFVNSKGQSVYSLCDKKEEFLTHFQVSQSLIDEFVEEDVESVEIESTALHNAVSYPRTAEIFKIADLRQACDNTGKSALTFLLERDHEFFYGSRIKDFSEFKAYAAAYDEHYGEGHFKAHVVRKFGGSIVFEALREDAFVPEVAEFMVDEMGVSMDRLVWLLFFDWGDYLINLRGWRLMDAIVQCHEFDQNRCDLDLFLLKHGYDTNSELLIEAIKTDSFDLLNIILKHHPDISKLCENFSRKCSMPFNKAYRQFILFLFERGDVVLERCFYRPCDSMEELQFLLEIGLDVRKLICTRKCALIDSYDRFSLKMLPHF